MFTTDLSHRVFFLTVSILLLGVRPDQTAEAAATKTNDKKEGSRITPESNFESKSIDDDEDIFDIVDLPELRSDPSPKSARRNEHGPSVMIKANLPFTTTADDYPVKTNKEYRRRHGSPASYPNNGNFFDCFFGKNCPGEMEDKDEWRNYYSVLNGLDKPGERYGPQLPFGGGPEFQTGISAALPFIVDAGGGNQNRDEGYNRRGDDKPPSSFRRYTQSGAKLPTPPRLSRTTTSAPSWVKLQRVPAQMYDPFMATTTNKNNGGKDKGSGEHNPSKFASRVGQEEMSPEGFADRYGWNKDSMQTLRLPAWLEELNRQHSYRGPPERDGPNRPNYGGHRDGPGSSGDDDGKSWIKLDPIPVSGVTISKWVPKGTSPSELPSTNWPVRDKPNAWWDRIDVRPESSWSDGPIRSPLISPSPSNSGSWGSQRYPSNNNKKHHHGSPHQSINDPWSDIIYPDTPVSATASWESSKPGGSPGSSPFPSSWLSNGNSGNSNSGNKYSGRPIASWSASGSTNSNSKINAGRFGNQPSSSFGRPSYYPDPQAGPNDPRWVLISTTGETSVKNPPYKGHIPDYEYHSNRHSKDMNLTKLLFGSSTTERPIFSSTPLTQDEIFRRTNETLSNLSPVFHNRVEGLKREGLSPDEQLEPFHTFLPILDGDMSTTTTEVFRSSTEGPKVQQPANPPGRSDNLLRRINPVLAAVGVGMIPATLAAVLPAALGRRRKRRSTHWNERSVRESDAVLVPRLVLTQHYGSPILLSSSAPNMYKFLRKPAMRESTR